MTETSQCNGARLLDMLSGLIVASIAAAAIIALAHDSGTIFPIAVIGTALFGTVFGMPAFAIARDYGRDTPLAAAITGASIGSLPALLGWTDDALAPSRLANPISAIIPFAVGGAAGGLIFLALATCPSKSGQHWTGLKGLLSVASLSLLWLLPYATMDRSCHNPLRNGGRSIATAAILDLHIGVDQWAVLEAELDAFGQSGHWSARRNVSSDPDFPWFQISLCKAAGTKILAMSVPPDGDISIMLYQPQGGAGWQSEFRALYRRLDSRWPGRIKVPAQDGRPTDAPDWMQEPGPQPKEA